MMVSIKGEENQEDIRQKHHEISREFITKNLIDLLNSHERMIIGEISYAHRDFIPIEKVDRIKTIRHSKLGDIKIRVRFLASLLRFADACDLCHTRTSEVFTNLSNISEESHFYHTLHERISGINFNQENKSIELSINIKSDEEIEICKRFTVDKLRKTFNTVRDVFVRNDVMYVDIIPIYSRQPLLNPLKVPSSFDIEKKLSFEMNLTKIESQARVSYLKKQYPKSIRLLRKVLKSKPNDLFYLTLLAQALSQKGDVKEASKIFKKVVDLNPENNLYWATAGHFFGEIIYDIKESFKCLKKAWELSPTDDINVLNYAEALITIGEFDDSYQLATKIWRENNNINRILDAQVIRIFSLFMNSKTDEGKKELQRLIDLYLLLPKIPDPAWVYNKLRKILNDSKISKNDKKSLLWLLDVKQKKMSINDFLKKQIQNKK